MNCYSSLLKKQIKNPLRNQKSPHMNRESSILSFDWLQKQKSQNNHRRRNCFRKSLAGGRQKAQNTWNIANDLPMFCKIGSGFVLLKGQTGSCFMYEPQARLFKPRPLSWLCQRVTDCFLSTPQPYFSPLLFLARQNTAPKQSRAKNNADFFDPIFATSWSISEKITSKKFKSVKSCGLGPGGSTGNSIIRS